jgi:hypothetical protein
LPFSRATTALAKLGVLEEQPKQLTKVVVRIELFLWKFLRMRWYDAHLFFSSVEPKEAMDLIRERYEPGLVYRFLSERQDDLEWENSMTVGISLLFAAMRQAEKQGFNPKTAGIFTLHRMLEQALDEVTDLEDLLKVGAPPE